MGKKEFGRIFGVRSHHEAFGHNGNICCNAWVDPTREMVLVYLTNQLVTVTAGVRTHGALSDLAIAACR